MTQAMSVVIATYNGANFIERQIESLLSQTVPPAELIVADDGSTDATMDLVAKAVAQAPFPVRLFVNPKRKGYRSNFVEAAGLSESPLVAFCDQDDIWQADKIGIMTRAFENPEVLLAYHNASIIDTEEIVTGRLYGPDGPGKRSESTVIDPWSFPLGFTQVFRRDLLTFQSLQPMSRDFLFAAERLAHDQWYYLLATFFGKIAFIDKDLVAYRQHSSNVFGATNKAKSGIFSLLKSTLDHSRDEIEGRRQSLEVLERILRTIAATETYPAHYRRRANEFANHYKDLAALRRARIATYDRHIGARLLAWLRLVASWRRLRNEGLIYLPRHAVRDLALGVTLGGFAAPSASAGITSN